MPFPSPYIIYLLALILSAGISIYAVRKIIFMTRRRKIYDIPDNIRKIHGAEIPSLGGIGIFIGYIIVTAFLWPRNHMYMPYVLASSSILFFTGIYDDIMNMRPSKKLVAQLLASFITIYFADVRIQSLYGFCGIDVIPFWPGVLLTTVCCTFFINVFNFIDGIDGLAGVLAVLYLGLLGVSFATIHHEVIAAISFSLAGATIGLLFFNIAPAKIYMGDTGSMFLGFTIFTFSLLFINWCNSSDIAPLITYVHTAANAMMLVVAMLFVPIFDAIRVFIVRASKGISPLKADRTHLHYYLLDAGFTHSQAVSVIAGTNVLTIAITYAMQDMNPALIILCMTVLSLVVLIVVYRMKARHK